MIKRDVYGSPLAQAIPTPVIRVFPVRGLVEEGYLELRYTIRYSHHMLSLYRKFFVREMQCLNLAADQKRL